MSTVDTLHPSVFSLEHRGIFCYLSHFALVFNNNSHCFQPVAKCFSLLSIFSNVIVGISS
nr:MAG TPA: hypothetical protein [Caudoviricetes sp.]